MSIKIITEEEARQIIQEYPNSIGAYDDTQRYIVMNPDDTCTALDNRTGHCWTEDFTTKEQAIRYLNGEDAEHIRKGGAKK